MKKLYQIQLLRGLGAVLILIYHLKFIAVGEFSVDLFLCISGFVMMYSTEKSYNNILKKRIIRLIPLYYIFTIFMYLILKIMPSLSLMSSAKISYLIKSLLFIPYVSFGANNTPAIVPIIPVAWTLNFEVYFYLIFALSNKINHEKRGIISSCIIILFFLLGLIVNSKNMIFNNLTDSIILEFIFGIISFYLYKNLSKKININNKRKYLFIIFSILCLVCLTIFNKYKILSNIRLIRYGILTFIIFNNILFALDDVKIPDVFIKLGNISYSFFLVECFTSAFFNKVYSFLNINSIVFNIFLVVIAIVITYIVSYISWYLIENKFNKFLCKVKTNK